MPEGDSIAQAARMLSPLVGARLVYVGGSHRTVRSYGSRLRGRRVERVRAVGKHLLIEVQRDWTIRTHMGMTGSWHLYRPDEAWRRSPGKARVTLATEDHIAVCFSAPTVDIGPSDRVRQTISHLGPDLLGEDFDVEATLTRVPDSDASIAADLLLDQRVAAGIGNVYKSEVLFHCGVAPSQPASSLTSEQLRQLYTHARKLLVANAANRARSTTGERRRGARLWVYGRAGAACRRCGSGIHAAGMGTLGRITYWCPSCQPTSPRQPT